MTGEPDGLTAVLLQLAALTQKLAELDQRQTGDARDLTQRITTVASLVDQLKDTTASHAQVLAGLDGLDRQVAGLAAQAATDGPADGDGNAPGYQPSAAPKFWKLEGPAREEAITKLRAWVEQVYRPGYGHLAATLGPCWEAHDLCLYGLDILAQLWQVLYLQPVRSGALLSAQAEYQARILPAIAAQLMAETTSCVHDHAARMQAPAYTQRLP